MSLETPINYNCNIECPNCAHTYLYNFKIDDLDKFNANKNSEGLETKYKFISYLICKNPICNYDIELKGYVLEYPENLLDSIEITNLK